MCEVQTALQNSLTEKKVKKDSVVKANSLIKMAMENCLMSKSRLAVLNGQKDISFNDFMKNWLFAFDGLAFSLKNNPIFVQFFCRNYPTLSHFSIRFVRLPKGWKRPICPNIEHPEILWWDYWVVKLQQLRNIFLFLVRVAVMKP